MKKNELWMMSLGLVLPLCGCPGDDTPAGTEADDTTTTTTTDGMTDTTAGTVEPTTGSTTEAMETTVEPDTTATTGDPPGACLGTSDEGAAVGEACTANGDCASGVCTIYTDVPLNDDAVCAETPADCSTRVTGTIFDFVTREPLPGADLIVAAALQAATNPTGAMPLMEAQSGADGRVDATSDGPIAAPIGIVALTSAGGYFLTATGVASPADGASAYNVAGSIHDLWAVPASDLMDWSDALAMDAMIPAENLPLGEAGGVVGLVRDSAGMPVEGAVVTSTDGGSGAFIRYLNDDGTFGTDSTSTQGIFVILEPALAEEFEADVGGNVIGPGTAGSADGAIFTLIFNAD